MADMEQQKSIFLSPGISLTLSVLVTERLNHIWVWENVGPVMTNFNDTTNFKYLLAFI